jgi:hypothetical protein
MGTFIVFSTPCLGSRPLRLRIMRLTAGKRQTRQ